MQVIDNEIHGAKFDFCFDNQSYGEFLFNQAEKYPINVCHIDAETGYTETYHEVRQKCIRIAIKMTELNITPNDVIVICSYNHMDSALPIYAAQYLGAKIASLDPTLSKRDCSYLLDLVKPKMIFVGPESAHLIDEVTKHWDNKPLLVIFEANSDMYISFDTFLTKKNNEDIFKPTKINDLNEPAFIYFSSGTTGLPKGINVSHRTILYASDGISRLDFVFDCCLHLTTYYWISALMLTTFAFMAGGRRVVCKKCNVENIIKLCSDFKVTYAFLATSYAYCFKEDHFKYDLLPELAIVISGGKVSYKLLKKLKGWLPNNYIESTYGMTELSGCTTIFHPVLDKNIVINSKWASSGKPIPGFTLRIADLDNGQSLGANKKGEIRIKSVACTSGYYGVPSADIYDENGWLKTGDIGYYDENYSFYVVDRIKEMFKYKSWHIVPAVLETIILEYPAVRECTVFGTPHETDGDLPTAAIILEENCNDVKEEDIIKFVNMQVSDKQKLRGGVKFVQEFPRTSSGKILKGEIRNLLISKKKC